MIYNIICLNIYFKDINLIIIFYHLKYENNREKVIIFLNMNRYFINN